MIRLIQHKKAYLSVLSFEVLIVLCVAVSLKTVPTFSFLLSTLILFLLPLIFNVLFTNLEQFNKGRKGYIRVNVISYLLCMILVEFIPLDTPYRHLFYVLPLLFLQLACFYDDFLTEDPQLFKKVKCCLLVPFIKSFPVRLFCWSNGFLYALAALVFTSFLPGILSSLVMPVILLLSLYIPFLMCCFFKKIAEKMSIIPTQSVWMKSLLDFLGICIASSGLLLLFAFSF